MLEGDPTQPGVFTMRLRFPDGFQVLPHWHTQVAHATVIAGVLHLGMGDRFDRAATRKMPAGSFGYWPAGTRHFAWARSAAAMRTSASRWDEPPSARGVGRRRRQRTPIWSLNGPSGLRHDIALRQSRDAALASFI
jgi:hypothetical protein